MTYRAVPTDDGRVNLIFRDEPNMDISSDSMNGEDFEFLLYKEEAIQLKKDLEDYLAMPDVVELNSLVWGDQFTMRSPNKYTGRHGRYFGTYMGQDTNGSVVVFEPTVLLDREAVIVLDCLDVIHGWEGTGNE